MLDKLKTFIKKTFSQELFAPSRFDDPVALNTEWTAANSGGSNFHSHKLYSADYNRVEFRATQTSVSQSSKNYTRLSNIHAIQLLSEFLGKPVWDAIK